MTPIPRTGGASALWFAVTVAALAGCGGGADGTGIQVGDGGGAGGGGGGGSPVAALAYSSGTMVRGSVILNGVRFDDTGAQVDDDRGRGVAALATGMQVTLRGRVNDDGLAGTAERVSVRPELRGTVTSVDLSTSPAAFVVGGVRVQTDDATVFADGLAIGSLQGGRVEVHALRDASGALRATRVEPLPAQGVADELRGPIVSGLSGGRFTIASGPGATVTVAASSAGVAYFPAGCGDASMVAGRVVEVHGAFGAAGTFTATRIGCEDLADDSRGLRPPSGARNEIEGFVTGLDATAGTFRIGTITVQRTATTQIRRGALADLANGARVEVDGTLSGSVLVAREISFKRDQVRLQGAVQSVAGTASFVVLGRTVRRDALTEFKADRFAVGQTVQVRGALASDGALVAEEVDDGSGSDGREILQAPVTAKTGNAIVLLGTTVTLPATATYRRADGTAFPSVQAFLDAITAGPTGGTLVKVRGTPLATRVEEAEIQF
jgi:hypothetical protein